MIDQQKAVEQLWYTWSDVGLDTIRAGFRIRAASEGLKDIRSVRVQNLDRYQRYSLPRDVNPAIHQGIAPVCLSLIATEQGRILVHKEYTGKDAVGRYGVFFIHLLVDLPEEFTARDAISLWRSSFWQNSDVSLKDRRSTNLDPVSLKHLEKMRKDIPLNASIVQKYLPYVIQAYLTKKPLIEKNPSQKVPQKLYIAASDDDIAQLISGLTYCLPEQLLKGLTFSTYEHDVTEATTEIIGTCWLSVPEPEKDPHVEHLLPNHYYQEKLAINCYTGRYLPLENNLLVENKPLAAKFAQDATESFLRGGTKEFKKLLDRARHYSDLDVDKFLNLYESLIIRAQNPSKQNIEFVLMPQSYSDYEYSAEMLSTQGYQRALIDLIMGEPDWWWTFGQAAIINLRNQSTTMPTLAQALSLIAQRAIPEAMTIVRERVPMAKAIAPGEVIINEEATFKIIVDLMHCAAPPDADPEVWLSLLRELLTIKDIFAFFKRYWDIYADLMRLWSRILPLSLEINKLIQPLLSISWVEFGDFLALRLPLDWNEMATKALISQSSSVLGEETVRHLEQKYHPFIEDFLRQLLQDSQRWSTAGSLFNKLAAGKYGKKLLLLFILLDSAMGKYEENAERLLWIACLTADEKVLFLEHYGRQYLPLANKMSRTILGMFGELVRSDVPKEKMRVLFCWLDSPLLSPWFDSPSMGERNLAMVLDTAHLNEKESGEFFKRYGQKYISLYPRSSTLLKLFSKYAEIGAEARIYLLSFWRNLPLDQQTFDQVLLAAHLTASEKTEFLERYGEYDIARYPHSQVLLSYIGEYLGYLWGADIDIFKRYASPEEPSATEKLLRFLLNSSLLLPSRESIYDWYVVGGFVRKPSLLGGERKKIAESIGRLLKTQKVPQETHMKLIKKLAVACIEDEQGLTGLVDTLREVLTRQDLLQLFNDIAESAREGIRQKQYAKTLFVPCILFALSFKTVFSKEAQPEHFLQRFLKTLLYEVDEKTFNWLDAEAKKWPSEVYAEWKKYEPPRSPRPAPPSRFERFKLWWEQIVAFVQIRLVWALTGIIAFVLVAVIVGFWINANIIIPGLPITSVNGHPIPQSEYRKLVAFKAQMQYNQINGKHGIIAQRQNLERQDLTQTQIITNTNTQITSLKNQIEALPAGSSQRASLSSQLTAAQQKLRAAQAQHNSLQQQINTINRNTLPLAQADFTQSQVGNDSATWLQDDELIREWLANQSPALQARINPTPDAVNRALNAFKADFPANSSYDKFLSSDGVSNGDMQEMMALKLRRDNMQTYLASLITSPTYQVLARQISLPTMSDAQNVLNQLQHGADFGALAKAKSLDTDTASKGGSWEWLARGQLAIKNSQVIVENWIFDPHRKIDEISPIIRENGDYHIVQILGIDPSRPVDSATLKSLKDNALFDWLLMIRALPTTKVTPVDQNMLLDPMNLPPTLPSTAPSSSNEGVPGGTLPGNGGGSQP